MLPSPGMGVEQQPDQSQEPLKTITPQPEDLLTSQEAEVLQRADRGELICPCCLLMLGGQKVVAEEYEGVILRCDCGFVEV